MQQNGVQKGQPQNLENLLNQVVGQLGKVAKRVQSIASSPLEELPVNVLCRVMELTSQLQSVVRGLQKLPTTITEQGQLQTRIADEGQQEWSGQLAVVSVAWRPRARGVTE
ncbi:hypothetical protein HU200_022740 [Digitaria exilis]|uniref:Uncharacterized protein n=1 Tax=Digitaria exilis TaxID=1010633 RepID=A0A835C463_9POAL|nr:hypothetical protein HU200_022740 [Digitaria exilis]